MKLSFRARFIGTLAGLLILPIAVFATQKPGAASNRTRLLRSWEDTVKVGGTAVSRRMDLIFDYTEGVARLLAYDAAGRLVSSTSYSENLPRPSRDEIAEAIGIIRADAEMDRIFTRTRAIPEGGFLLEEGPGGVCGPKTRCVQILWLSETRYGLVRWVVVDLMKGAIVYRTYVPQNTTEVAK